MSGGENEIRNLFDAFNWSSAMTRKLAAAAWMGIFAFGLSGCGDAAPDGKLPPEDIFGPIEAYRADAAVFN